ncbi:MAG: hypothetical protein R3E12_15660 [Candidatus Eisenbacteria bacterium]
MPDALQPGEHDDRLSQSHVVGEASAQPVPFQRGEPPQRLALVRPEASLEGRGKQPRIVIGSARDVGTRRAESLVDRHTGRGAAGCIVLRIQHCVQERRLGAGETDAVLGLLAHLRDQALPPQPFLGQDPEAPVAEQHPDRATTQSREHRTDVRGERTVRGIPAQLEPVEPRLHLQLDGLGETARASRRFHAPSRGQQVGHDTGEPRHGQLKGIGRRPESQRRQPQILQIHPRVALDRHVPTPTGVAHPVDDDRAGIRAGDHRSQLIATQAGVPLGWMGTRTLFARSTTK